MLWCERVAPLGKPVVPVVYWMLMGSSKASVAARSEMAELPPSRNYSSKSGVPMNTARSKPIDSIMPR
jgi:hypothetical protein